MYQIVKRAFDLIVSLIVILLLLPILLPICIILKFTGEGYVFYFQKRIGYKNSYFHIWKFSTMLKDSPKLGTGLITTRNDPRVFAFGRFLRKTKINELPQIINVLIGNMSFVGPRPLVDQTFNAYPEYIQKQVYDTKPGITGIGSIIFRDEEHLLSTCTIPPHEFYKEYIAPYKGELEIWYKHNISFLTDLKILFLTAWVIIFPESTLYHKVFKDLPKRSF